MLGPPARGYPAPSTSRSGPGRRGPPTAGRHRCGSSSSTPRPTSRPAISRHSEQPGAGMRAVRVRLGRRCGRGAEEGSAFDGIRAEELLDAESGERGDDVCVPIGRVPETIGQQPEAEEPGEDRVEHLLELG